MNTTPLQYGARIYVSLPWKQQPRRHLRKDIYGFKLTEQANADTKEVD